MATDNTQKINLSWYLHGGCPYCGCDGWEEEWHEVDETNNFVYYIGKTCELCGQTWEEKHKRLSLRLAGETDFSF